LFRLFHKVITPVSGIVSIFLILFLIFCLSDCHSPDSKNVVAETDTITPANNDTIAPVVDSLFILLDNLKTDSVLKHASVSYVIYNMTKDSLVAELNPYLSLVPASTLKLLTSAAALEILGPDLRFKTTLCYDGSIEGRSLFGNIYIVGGGDPALGSAIYKQSEFLSIFIKAIKDLNIDSIHGHIIADPSIFDMETIPYTWAYGEVNEAYAAAASGLTVYDNTYLYEILKHEKGLIKPEADKLFPQIPLLSFYNNFVVTDEEKHSLNITNRPASNKKIIKGGFPASLNKVVVKGAIPDPAYYIAFELFEKLLNSGIYIKGSPSSIYDIVLNKESDKNNSRKQIAVIYSPHLLSIIQNVNMQSNNLFAEHLLKQIGLRKTGIGDTETGCSSVINFWRSKGLDVNGLFMYDGSGLSRFNAVTAKQLVDVLRYMRTSVHFTNFFNSLSQAGTTGTLKKLCVGSNADGLINAKSGTMSRVKSYAGYAQNINGDTLAFALMANNYICPSHEMTKKFEAIMIKMVDYK